MEQKTKFIVIGLVGFSVICLFLFISALSSKQLIVRERNDLKAENNSLNGKIGKLEVSLRDYDKKIASLNQEVQQATQERDSLRELNSKAAKNIDDLTARLRNAESKPQAPVRQESQAPQTDDAYWASILKQKTDLEMQISSLRNEFRDIQVKNEGLSRDNSGLQLELNNLRHEKDDLVRRLDYNQKVSDSISQELVREKNDKTKIENTYRSLKNENTILTRQIRALNGNRAELEKRILQIQQDKSGVERRVNEMESILTDKLGQIGTLKQQIESVRSGKPMEAESESVELPAIVVKPSTQMNQQELTPGARRGGSILAVNRDNNFVIVDLGQASGIKAGDKLRVFRDGKNVGNVEVIQVRQDISACDIKRETTALKIGDTVDRS